MFNTIITIAYYQVTAQWNSQQLSPITTINIEWLCHTYQMNTHAVDNMLARHAIYGHGYANALRASNIDIHCHSQPLPPRH